MLDVLGSVVPVTVGEPIAMLGIPEGGEGSLIVSFAEFGPITVSFPSPLLRAYTWNEYSPPVVIPVSTVLCPDTTLVPLVGPDQTMTYDAGTSTLPEGYVHDRVTFNVDPEGATESILGALGADGVVLTRFE